MADRFSKKKRSEIMSRIRSKNTGPEMAVRRILYALGFRFRTHARDLPGTPDVVMRKRKTVVDVRGCFWHKHKCRLGLKFPQNNKEFWAKKLALNAKRDSRNVRRLKAMGWRSIVVWECELRDLQLLKMRLSREMA